MRRVRFTVTPNRPLAGIAEMYREVERKYQDFRPAWRSLKPVFAAGVAQAILSEGASIGERWEALDPRYAERKAREGFGQQTMVRTGKLLAEQRDGKAGYSASRFGAAYYSKRRYAYPLQRGGGKAPYPSRPFFGFTPFMEEATLNAIQARIDQILVDAARRNEAFEARRGGS